MLLLFVFCAPKPTWPAAWGRRVARRRMGGGTFVYVITVTILILIRLLTTTNSNILIVIVIVIVIVVAVLRGPDTTLACASPAWSAYGRVLLVPSIAAETDYNNDNNDNSNNGNNNNNTNDDIDSHK